MGGKENKESTSDLTVTEVVGGVLTYVTVCPVRHCREIMMKGSLCLFLQELAVQWKRQTCKQIIAIKYSNV